MVERTSHSDGYGMRFLNNYVLIKYGLIIVILLINVFYVGSVTNEARYIALLHKQQIFFMDSHRQKRRPQ